MKITLSYNDLELLLTEEDRQQIKDVPMPSTQQAELMIKKWNDFFGSREVKKTPESVQTGMIWLKPYTKVKDNFPELFI